MENKNFYYWNVETIDFFQLLKHSEGDKKMKESVEMFVYNECDLEDDETFQELIEDLLYQINHTTLTQIENLKN